MVTGCAGFIGSHLAERLVESGCEVVGVDCFRDYYARALKEANLAALRQHARFELRELDLSRDDLEGLADGADALFHLAGRPGARGSAAHAAECERDNVVATARLLDEAARRPPGTFVYASSSSVYGDARAPATAEPAPRRPRSRYAESKVRVEELATRVRLEHGLPVVGLRYFSVYGPRQRPDMAFSRFLRQALAGRPLTVFGDGSQVRDFTYVGDAIDATLLAAARGRPGRVYNVAAGRPVSLAKAIGLIGELVERPLTLAPVRTSPEDPARTAADTSRARVELGFEPTIGLARGLARQLDWHLAESRVPAAA